MKGARVLVTGSSGFVGRRLVAALEAAGAVVVPFSTGEGRDVTRWEDFDSLDDVNVVYHLAARTFVPASFDDPRDTIHVNVAGTNNALAYAHRAGARFVFASSYLYGAPDYLPVDEAHPIRPANPYAWSKYLGEQLCHAYSENHGVRCVILRTFNLYGGGHDERFLIPEIVAQIHNGDVVTLRDLTPRRDFLHVDDAVDAYMRAGDFESDGCEVFNIGFGASFSVREIAEKLIALSGRDIELCSLNDERQGEVSDTVADIARAKRMLGWTPTIALDEGLRELVA